MLVGGGLESMWQIRRASSLRPTPMVCIGRSHLGLSVDPSIRLEKGEEKKGDAELNLIKVNFVDIFKAWVSKNQFFGSIWSVSVGRLIHIHSGSKNKIEPTAYNSIFKKWPKYCLKIVLKLPKI